MTHLSRKGNTVVARYALRWFVTFALIPDLPVPYLEQINVGTINFAHIDVSHYYARQKSKNWTVEVTIQNKAISNLHGS